MSYRKMTPLFVVLLGFTLFFILGCTTTTNVNVDDLRIIAADAVEVPIGEYTVPYTIENINDYVDEYGLVVEVSAVDQFNNPVDTTQNVFTVVAGRIYTVRIRAIINGETAEELVITITAVALSIQSIVITTPPTKTNYVEGETFDPSGMVVTAIYSDLSSSVVHDISYLTTPLGLSNTTWTITHIASGKTATVSLTIIPLSEAVWTVQFDGNGGQLISGVETQAIHHGESAIAPVYTKKDCIFNGFDVSFDNVTSHLSVTAQWIDTTVGTAGLVYSQNGQTFEVSGCFATSAIVMFLLFITDCR